MVFSLMSFGGKKQQPINPIMDIVDMDEDKADSKLVDFNTKK